MRLVKPWIAGVEGKLARERARLVALGLPEHVHTRPLSIEQAIAQEPEIGIAELGGRTLRRDHAALVDDRSFGVRGQLDPRATVLSGAARPTVSRGDVVEDHVERAPGAEPSHAKRALQGGVERALDRRSLGVDLGKGVSARSTPGNW